MANQETRILLLYFVWEFFFLLVTTLLSSFLLPLHPLQYLSTIYDAFMHNTIFITCNSAALLSRSRAFFYVFCTLPLCVCVAILDHLAFMHDSQLRLPPSLSHEAHCTSIHPLIRARHIKSKQNETTIDESVRGIPTCHDLKKCGISPRSSGIIERSAQISCFICISYPLFSLPSPTL